MFEVGGRGEREIFEVREIFEGEGGGRYLRWG